MVRSCSFYAPGTSSTHRFTNPLPIIQFRVQAQYNTLVIWRRPTSSPQPHSLCSKLYHLRCKYRTSHLSRKASKRDVYPHLHSRSLHDSHWSCVNRPYAKKRMRRRFQDLHVRLPFRGLSFPVPPLSCVPR